MKKHLLFLTILIIFISTNQTNAQFSLILKGLESLGGVIEAGDGYVSTLDDLKQAQRALDLINESRCLMDNLAFSIRRYEEEVGLNCFDDMQFRLVKVRLDNSAIQIADQIAANAQGVLGIFNGIVGGQGDEQTISAINKTVISDAINNAIKSLFEAKELEQRAKMELHKLERLDTSVGVDLAVAEFVLNPPSSRERIMQKLKNEGDKEFEASGGIIGLLVTGLTILMLVATGYTLMFKQDGLSPQLLYGLLGSLVILTIANTLV